MKRLFTFLLGMVFMLQLSAQGTITGQIIDENGEPLPGASIYLEELRLGAIADKEGIYKLEGLPSGTYTVRFTFVGYETIKRKTVIQEGIGKNLMHVQMEERVSGLRPAVIWATRAGENDPFTFTNFDKEKIEAENLGVDVPYLLQRTPSAVVTSDAGTGIGYTGIRIRGTDPTRINITINGVPLNDAESQGVFWVNLPDFASSTEDIQIQRGVGTSTNGAAAFGASINLNSSVLKPDPYAVVDLSGGSFNTLRGSLRFGTGTLGNGFSLDGRLSQTTSDGYIDRASADLRSWYLSGAWVGEKHWLRMIAFSGQEVTYQSWFGVDRETAENPETRTFNPAGTEKEGEPYENQVDDYTQTHYQMLYGWNINRNMDLSVVLHYTRGFGFFEEYKAGQGLSDYGLLPEVVTSFTDLRRTPTSDLVRRRWLDNHFYGSIFSLNYTSNSSRYRATLGGGWNNYLGAHFGEVIWAQNFGTGVPEQRYYDNDGTKQDLNLYLKQSQKIGQFVDAYLDLQYRRVDYEFLGFDQNGKQIDQNVSHNFFNPKAGLSFDLENAGFAYVSFAVANREPNRDDYVDSSPNSRPTPERLYDVELGYRKQWQKASLEANLYYMIYQDQLVLTGQLNDVGAFTRVNVPESFRRGIELVGGIRPVSWFEIGGNLTLSQNQIQNFTEFLDSYDENFEYITQEEVFYENTELAFSPAVVGALDLVFYPLAGKAERGRDLQIGLLNKYVGEQFVDNSGAEASSLDAYFVTDLRLEYSWVPKRGAKSVALTFMARNLTNQLYSSNGWSYRFLIDGGVDQLRGFYPQAGINFLGGVRVEF